MQNVRISGLLLFPGTVRRPAIKPQPENVKELITQIKSQIKALQSEREVWEPLWDEVWEMTNPARRYFGEEAKSASKKLPIQYNSRGRLALKKSSAGFQGYTANRHSNWFKLALSGMMMKLPGVRRWLEQCEPILYTEFNASGFYEALGELNMDTHAIGPGIIYTEEDIKRKRMVYQCRHPLGCWIAENAFGEIDTLHENVYLTYKAAMERFELSDRKQELGKQDPFKMLTIRHAVMPMTEEWSKIASVDSRMPFVSVWYDSDEDTILDVGGYWEFPFIVSRFQKDSTSPYGFGPGVDALGDILGATQMTKSRIRLAQLVADPTLTVPEDLEGQDDVIPGGRIYTGPNTGKIEPVQIGANYPITIDTEERQGAIIDDHFNVNIYLMLQQAQGQMTAREVIERTGEKAAILGYVTGRYTTEVLQPLIQRTFNVLMRAGKLPPPPQSLMSAQEPFGWNIEFLGFMSQMQRKYYATGGINSGIEYIGVIGQMFPESMDIVNGDGLMREALEAAATPAAGIREEQEVAQIRMIKQQMLQQQQQQEQEAMLLQNMDKMNKQVEPNSPLEAMGKQLAARGQQ